jgi:hypothetical protein
MMTRQMVDSILLLTERERFSKGIMSWVGFETKWIPYENVERLAGKSKWNFFGLVKYALSGFIAFATAPLRAVIYFGSIIVFFAVIYAVYLVYEAIRYPENNGSGFGTIVLLILFFGGVLITLLGVIGEYIARIYMELKHRPIYIEKINTLKDK